MALYHHQIDDFVELTLSKFKKDQWVDISLPLQEYKFAGRVFEAKKKPERGGPRLDWKLRVNNQGTAKHSGRLSTTFTISTKTLSKVVLRRSSVRCS